MENKSRNYYTNLSKKMKTKMKNMSLPIFLILALAFAHEANAGKIVGTLESSNGPMDRELESEDEAMPIPDDPANEPKDRELESEDGLILMDRELVASSKYSKTTQFAIFGNFP